MIGKQMTGLAGFRCSVKTPSDRGALLHGITIPLQLSSRHRFGQGNAYFRLTGSHDIGSRTAKVGRITQVGATDEYAQFRVHQACLPDDFSSIRNICAQN